MKLKSVVLLVIAGMLSIFAISCSDAEIASNNVSRAADQFEIYRRVVFYNGITDKYILSIEGYCSIESVEGRLEVMVKLQDGKYLKHFLGLSDNVTYFAEQIVPEKVSDKSYKVIFKPSAIVPDIDVN